MGNSKDCPDLKETHGLVVCCNKTAASNLCIDALSGIPFIKEVSIESMHSII